ncbi:hypothetical protein [Larkinella sp. C7]|uniref:hypothetical protein n=1 Tax=Larkinella sp. C7 TaxID=2576607 RepID=UPI00111121C9|nr:hypothetical protein [Larkinella sp. C7]
MQLKELFKKLATRAGVNATEAKLTAAIDALPELDVDDDLVAKPLIDKLITEEEAGNRPTLKKKFAAEALNGADAIIDPILAELFTPEEIEALKKEEKATMKKIGKLATKAKELKTAGGNPTDTAKAIADLNTEITKLKTEKESEVNTLKKLHEEERYFDRLASKVIRRSDVVDYAKAKEGVRVVADFKDTLNTVGGILDITTGKIMQKADPSMELYIDNKAVTADLLLEKTLTENEYLKKSEGPGPAGSITVPGGGNEGQMTEAQKRNAERFKQQ